MNVTALVCVVAAGLSVGVLTAYGICVAMFAAFRMHAQRLHPANPVAAAATVGPVAGAATAIGS